MGRPRKYESDAARVAAFRSRKKVATVDVKQAATLDAIAAHLDCSRNELLHSMVQFALMNRNWRQVGLFGSRTWSTPTEPASSAAGAATPGNGVDSGGSESERPL